MYQTRFWYTLILFLIKENSSGNFRLPFGPRLCFKIAQGQYSIQKPYLLFVYISKRVLKLISFFILQKYYPPDFDASKIPKLGLSRDRQYVVRLMAPFNMRQVFVKARQSKRDANLWNSELWRCLICTHFLPSLAF